MKLTLPQEDVYFEQLIYPDEPIYNIGAKIEIKGFIDTQIFHKAYQMLIQQHDAYRISLKGSPEEPLLFIKDENDTDLHYMEFSLKENPLQDALTFIQEEFEKPFDMFSQKMLHKFILIKVSDKFHFLFSVYHHLITDGWGTSLMFQRLVSNYNQLINKLEVSNYEFSYLDFIENDELYRKSDDYEKDKSYWSDKFDRLPPQLFRLKQGVKHRNKSERHELIVKRETYDRLEQLSKEYRSSTFHLILGILYTYLFKRYGEKDLTVGLPVLNRSKAIFKKTVGLFMGIAPLRINMDEEKDFSFIISLIKSQLRLDYRYQRFPLGKLIKELGLSKERNPLFNISLSYEKQDYADHFHNTETRVMPLSHKAERVALAIYIREFDSKEDVKIDFDYNLSYFSKEEIEQFTSHFEFLMQKILENPTLELKELSYFPDTERNKIIKDFNDTKQDFDLSKTVLHGFDKMVSKYPHKKAIEDGVEIYTYNQLSILSDQIANYLSQHHHNSNTPILLLMERSVAMVSVMLGIFRSGNYFIPLDIKLPEERISYVFENSGAILIITDQDGSTFRKPELNKAVVSVEQMFSDSSSNLQRNKIYPSPEDTAYVIYTSGSTGNPKGVEVGHFSLMNFLLSMKQKPGFEESDKIFAVTTYSFDISLLELLLPLISGGELYLVNDKLLSNPFELVKTLEEIKPSIIQATPSFYQMLLNTGWEGDLNIKILCGGDKLNKSLARELLKRFHCVWNMYGPTETTIWSSIKKIEHPEDASNIGKPIANTRFYVLDNSLDIKPIGTIGNLFIAGHGLAKGYLQNKELTDKKFIRDPFVDGDLMYETGDLAAWTSCGEMIYKGRIDYQVKIRGFRIELGEIETKLNAMSQINEAVVVAKQQKNKEAVLVAYLIAAEKVMEDALIIENLRKDLPDYMIPYQLVYVDDFPLTSNHKIDRKKLSERSISKRKGDIFVAPSTSQEQQLVLFFQELLDLSQPVSIKSNFFSMGGHSLIAVRLIGKIEKEIGARLNLKEIFENPTVYELSKYINSSKVREISEITKVPSRSYYPITFPQYTIWIASLQEERSIAYNMFAAYRLNGSIESKYVEIAFREVLNKYEILRTSFLEIDGLPVQQINQPEFIDFTLEKHSVSSNDELSDALVEFGNRKFDLNGKFLLRVGNFKVANGSEILVVASHHIVLDGWSIELIMADVIKGYNQLLSFKTIDLGSINLQFKDYALWQIEQCKEVRMKNTAFWKDYLKGYQWRPVIPYDSHETTDIDNNQGALYTFKWDKELYERLTILAVDNNVTLHTVLVVCLNILLSKLQKTKDICIGTINAGRSSEVLYDQVGMFVKTLPLRSQILDTETVSELIKTTHQDLLLLDAHQEIPQDLLSKIKIEAIFVLQNPTFNYEEVYVNENLQLELLPVNTIHNRLPLIINLSVNQQCLSGMIYYDNQKYTESTIELTMARFHKVLDQISVNSQLKINQINTQLDLKTDSEIEIEFYF
jgi:amino acid adenylation domain-containing protein